jgi:hypothetical protein
MGSNVAEWLVRTVMLVLAGLVTLSILGSIAAMSNQAGVPGLSGERVRPVLAPAPEPQPETSPQPRPQPDVGPGASPPGAASQPGTELVAVPAPPEEERPERWLEAIAYALLAIAGLLALLLVLLWRGVRALGRIADRAELRHQRP